MQKPSRAAFAQAVGLAPVDPAPRDQDSKTSVFTPIVRDNPNPRRPGSLGSRLHRRTASNPTTHLNSELRWGRVNRLAPRSMRFSPTAHGDSRFGRCV